ncbi:MAG: hypothetical protein WCO82_07550 [Sphingomonadales bacterium]|jgi:hypothetical protein
MKLSINHENISAIAAVVSAITAIFSIFIALISIFFTKKTLELQDRHNRLSVRPIPFVALANYENCIRVKINNDGSGPMIVKNVKISDGDSTYDNVIDCMPALPRELSWSNYTSSLVDRSIPPNEALILIELIGDLNDITYASYRDSCRSVLSGLTVDVTIEDIYGENFHTSRKLDWFSR